MLDEAVTWLDLFILFNTYLFGRIIGILIIDRLDKKNDC